MNKRFLTTAMLAFACAALLPAQDILAPITLERGLGGWHAAYDETFDSLFNNPANLAGAETEVRFLTLDVAASGPLFTIAQLIVANPTDPMTVLPNLFDVNGRLYTALDIMGPLDFAVVSDGFGLSIVNRTRASINASSQSNITTEVSETLLLRAGYGFSVALGGDHSLDFGFMAKGFLWGHSYTTTTTLGLATLITDVIQIFSANPFQLVIGAGLDAGISYNWGEWLTVSALSSSLLAPISDNRYTSLTDFADTGYSSWVSNYAYLNPIILDVGIAVRPPLGDLGQYIENLSIYLDYCDVFALVKPFYRNAILELSMGLELTVLDVLTLRAGIAEALPSAGFTIDLTAFSISGSMYGKELGWEPGSRPTFNVAVALDFTY